MVNSISGVLAAVNDTALSGYDALTDANVTVQVYGTFTGTLTFQTSNDGVTWYAKNMSTPSGVTGSTTTAAGVFTGDIGARYFRVVATALSAGPASVIAFFSETSQVVSGGSQTVSGTVTANLGTGGTSATSLGKAEDAAHASGDTGVATWGVRQPAVPTVPTSAAGDYGYMLVDSEGKQITTGTGAPEVAFQGFTALTAVTNVALKAAGAAGIRNYITDIVADNTGAAAARLIIQDGTTTIFSASMPANSTLNHSFKQPIRGTAATAVNGQLGAAGTVSVTISGFLGV